MTDREDNQRTGAETAGFHVRTVIDDTVAVLYAIRGRIDVEVPEGVAAALDDASALAERVLDLTEDLPEVPLTHGYRQPSRSACVSDCSCGGLHVHDVPESPSRGDRG